VAISDLELAHPVRRTGFRPRLREMLDRESFLGPLFISPALLLIALLVAYPFGMAIYLALSNAFIGRPSTFIGLRNFINLWDNDTFRQTFQNAFVFTGISVAFKLVLGVSLALLLNEALWFKRLIRGAVLLPWVIPTALSTLGWWWMFNSLYSVVNWTGIAMGLLDPPGPNWLGQKYYAMAAVVLVNIWRGLPFFAITILAGTGLVVTTNFSYAIGPPAAWIRDSRTMNMLISFVLVSVMVAAATRGLALGKWFHNVGGVVHMITFAVLILLPLFALSRALGGPYEPFAVQLPMFSEYNVNVGSKLALGALTGFEYVAILAGETRSPAKNIGRSVVIASVVSDIMMMRAPSGIDSPATPSGYP